MTIQIPALVKTIYKEIGSKNEIIQMVAPSQNINLSVKSTATNHAVIEFGSEEIHLTSKLDSIPENCDYGILTNVIPKKSRLENATIQFKNWIRHPQLKDHSPTDVIGSWKNGFSYKEEDIESGEPGLRAPQLSALHNLMGHLRMPMESGTVVMPTGTGKTETMLSALVAFKCERLLVTVPSDSLREQIASKFISLGLLKKFGVVSEDSLYPIVGVIKNRFKTSAEMTEFLQRCNVVVTTMAWLTAQSIDDQKQIAELFSQVFIDEAHHVKAHTWDAFRKHFPDIKVVQFTATPFRNDGQRLDGKIISNFPLKLAQQQGYYKKIKFIAVREYDGDKADQQIAHLAVKRLREDHQNGFNHILMARCATKTRAEKIFKLYEGEADLKPVVIYSGSPNFAAVYEQILKKEAKIIVCVDMLGEGFDLPELKVAAFHDIRRSLPITLQFAGRFTRTKYDEELGEASFIANIADLNVRAELEELYAEDADWNEILSDTSYERINEQVEFKDFMEGFQNLSELNIPFQNIVAKLSTVAYKNKTEGWFPSNFHTGIKGFEEFDFKFHKLNEKEKVLVIITGRQQPVEWIKHKDFYNVQWDMIVIFWDTKTNLLFINSSDNGSLYDGLAKAIIGDNAEMVRGINVFRSFYNIKRVKLQNVGLRQFLGKNIRFRMMVGSDVGEALSLAEKERGEKAFVMGNGYEAGEAVNVGASYKGRIWTKLKGDLKSYRDWCKAMGKKLIDETIDPNQILKETLIPELVTEVPNRFPVWIDWDVDMYMETETKYRFYINGFRYDLSSIELCLTEPKAGGPLKFSLSAEDRKATFEMQLFKTKSGDDEYADFKIIKLTPEDVTVEFGTQNIPADAFFSKYIPTIWFADGSALTGNEFVELKQQIGLFAKADILTWDWTGVNLANESQHVHPLKTDSIQYKVIQELKAQHYEFVYDDDYSGEIADVIAIKQETDKIQIKLYHLKYAAGGNTSNQITNFYEVCGQAQKSIHWKHKGGKDFVGHLLRRETKTRNGATRSRLEKGSKADLAKLESVMKNEIPVEFEIYVVQPALSKAAVSDDILTLLGVTQTFVKEFADINLKVIGSA
ncbi:DEAD/DEAH box helicase [Mucilaginibacter terrae]|uniref:Superfamily II DNA or RNA helicase n=1 Tax=Mucilaginibacter terrae TaxID=1955052 RepID=A0ABU3GRI0_9SPHI|nr:DEAD/DEAH box helicase family protein [Mucilaginibacter terrae]MDT3402250.1 superfamily II DNA or RNA helicase [Mucilaginibacter terrae]